LSPVERDCNRRLTKKEEIKSKLAFFYAQCRIHERVCPEWKKTGTPIKNLTFYTQKFFFFSGVPVFKKPNHCIFDGLSGNQTKQQWHSFRCQSDIALNTHLDVKQI
jgi:hypothetical protein